MELPNQIEQRSHPFRRSTRTKMIAGVAGGLAEYFDLDVGIVRVGLVALAIMGIGVPVYVAAWLLVPEEGAEETVADELAEHLRSRHVPTDVR